MGRSAKVLALAALALTLLGGPMAVAHATDRLPPGIGIRLVDVPVAAANDPRARSYIVDHVAPGTVIERRVEVSNGNPRAASVSMYPGAATIRDGTFTNAVGRTQNELSSWTELDQDTLTLGSQKRTFVDVTITVPRRATRGERYAVVWAEVRNAPAGGGVIHVDRVGIRIYLSVGPGGDPPSDFTITSVTAARGVQGAPELHAALRNTGSRALDLRARLRLSEGPGGVTAGPFPSDGTTTLGVGQSGSVTVLLDKRLPRGPWLARISVTSGRLTRTAQARVTFPSTRGAATTVPVDDGVEWWWWIVAATVLLVAAMVAFWAALRRRTSRRSSEERLPARRPLS